MMTVMRAERMRRGETLAQVSTAVRIPAPHLSLVERGRVLYLPPAWAARLAEHYGMAVDELLRPMAVSHRG